jgi:hypothetical protein
VKTRTYTLSMDLPWLPDTPSLRLTVEAEVEGEDDPGYFDPWDGGRSPESRNITLVHAVVEEWDWSLEEWVPSLAYAVSDIYDTEEVFLDRILDKVRIADDNALEAQWSDYPNTEA